MNSVVCRVVILVVTLVVGVAQADDHWNQFRGPRGDGIAASGNLPVEFDESTNVRWKTAIPDSGWSSPVVWQNEIWLTTGSDQQRELRGDLCRFENRKGEAERKSVRHDRTQS